MIPVQPHGHLRRAILAIAALGLAVSSIAAPAVTAPSVSAVDRKQATLSATLSEAADVTLLWGTDPADLWQRESLGRLDAGTFTHTVYTLLSGRHYYFRVIAENDGGTAQSDTVEATTTSAAPAHPRYSGGWYDGWACETASIAIPRAGTLFLLR